EPEGSPARRIVAWLQTDEGQKLIGDAGYVGVGSAKVAQGSAGPSEGGGDLALTDSSPMLWLLTQRSSNSWETLRERYGFISSTGKVSAKQYLNYAYCADNGRPTRAVATKGDSVDILGLDGEVQKALKHRYAYSLTCIANRFVVAYGNPTYEFISDPPLVYDLEKGSELTVPSFLEVSFEGRRGYSSRTLLDYVVSLAEPGRPFCMSDDVVGNEGAPDRQLDVDGNPVGTNTDCEPSDFVEPIPYCVDDKGQTHSNVPICLDWSELTDDGQVRLAWMGTLVPTGRIAQVKQGGFQGLKDADGKWVFKESSFQEFED
ncbi:MAG: hypothetical protein LBR21_01710, partial [Propionibacteriaceae bacterium]|nr:hypothetical protein [Propionibacteriaceae bacterium]